MTNNPPQIALLGPLQVVKISAAGEPMPIERDDHAAVLYPDFGVIFAVGAKGFGKKQGTFDAELKRAQDLKHAGAEDWTLAPDVRLQLLTVDYTRFSPAADPRLYPDAVSGWHWTAHGCAWAMNEDGAPRALWQVYGYYGHVHGADRGYEAFSRPCRFVARPGQ